MDRFRLNRKMECRKQAGGVAIGCFLFCALFLMAACEKAPVKPVEIKTSDVCFYCKSPITDLAYAAEFVTKDGFVRKFDDMSCLVANAKRVGKKNIVAFYASDMQSKTLFPLDQVQLVHADKLATPRNGGVFAFKDPAGADGFMSKVQAANISAEKVTLDDLLK